jgi:sporulation protein YlmC with PRC-barrel domain
MAELTAFMIGAAASCSDGLCGRLSRVVVDPVARSVTHLVIEPRHGHGHGRLVPVALANATDSDIRIRCRIADFEKLDPAEERHFLPESPGYPGYDPQHVLHWPYYRGGLGPVGGSSDRNISQTVSCDCVPPDEVQVRRDDQVHATDGFIGRVEGLVIDPASRHVTQVLLQEGHLWGRKEVAIPIGAVTSVDRGIRLSLTRQEVADLPPADLDHRDR